MGGVLIESGEIWDEESFPRAFPDGLPLPAEMDWFMAMSADCLKRFTQLPPPRPAVDIRPWIAEWLAKGGREASPDAIEVVYRAIAQWEVRALFPHVRPALEELAAMGLRMGLISNTISDGALHRENFRKGGIFDFFEITVFSAEFGANKPCPSIFRHALSEMGLEPEQAWYLGDKPQRDVCGAHAAGMTAVLVNSKHVNRMHDAPENWPDLWVKDISALPAVLREAGG
jgi:putative hydrolase of the HAD superfamily